MKLQEKTLKTFLFYLQHISNLVHFQINENIQLIVIVINLVNKYSNNTLAFFPLVRAQRSLTNNEPIFLFIQVHAAERTKRTFFIVTN